jgi:hypothetical protein
MSDYVGNRVEAEKVNVEVRAEEKEPRLAKLEEEKEETLKNDRKCKSFKEPVTAMLQVATFAAAITFNIVLTPRDGQDTPGLVYLGYANSLFCGGIIGCVFIIITTEICHGALNRERQLQAEESKGTDISIELRPFDKYPGNPFDP